MKPLAEAEQRNGLIQSEGTATLPLVEDCWCHTERAYGTEYGILQSTHPSLKIQSTTKRYSQISSFEVTFPPLYLESKIHMRSTSRHINWMRPTESKGIPIWL